MSIVATRFAQTVLVRLRHGMSLRERRALTTQDGAFLTSAEARVGRPLTPMSYAGVARRTTRRAVRAEPHRSRGYGRTGAGVQASIHTAGCTRAASEEDSPAAAAPPPHSSIVGVIQRMPPTTRAA